MKTALKDLSLQLLFTYGWLLGFPTGTVPMKRSKLDGDRGRKDLSQIRVQVTRKQHTDQRIHIDSTPCYLSSIYVVTCLI
jgi:hypothetical protein